MSGRVGALQISIIIIMSGHTKDREKHSERHEQRKREKGRKKRHEIRKKKKKNNKQRHCNANIPIAIAPTIEDSENKVNWSRDSSVVRAPDS